MLDNRGNKKQGNRSATFSSGDDTSKNNGNLSHFGILSSDDEAIQVEPPIKAASTRGKYYSSFACALNNVLQFR